MPMNYFFVRLMAQYNTCGSRRRFRVILLVFAGAVLLNAGLMRTALGFQTRHTFTGQEKDVESGLLYYGARYYNPNRGRFTQPDPAIMNPSKEMLANPQLLNPYSYAANNPLKYTDPTGEKLMISDAYGIEFVNKAMEDLQSIYGGINMKESGEVGLNKGSRVGSWFTKDSKSLQLMKGVIDDKHTVTIHSGDTNSAGPVDTTLRDKNLYNGKGLDTYILFNPNTAGPIFRFDTVNDDGRTSSTQGRPPYIGLSHALIHSLHMSRGDVSKGQVWSQTGIVGNPVIRQYPGTDIIIPINVEELRTVGGLGYNQKKDITENMIRREKKLNQRNSY